MIPFIKNHEIRKIVKYVLDMWHEVCIGIVLAEKTIHSK